MLGFIKAAYIIIHLLQEKLIYTFIIIIIKYVLILQ